MDKRAFSGIRTVFLDIDDTLWWFSHNSALTFRHIFDLFGLERVTDYDKFHQLYLEVNNGLWERYHHGLIGKEQLQTERFIVPLCQAGMDRAEAVRLAEQLNWEYLTYLSQLPTLVPGAKHLLEHLNGRGYDVNTLSNGFNLIQQRKLHYSGIAHLVHRNVLSDVCGVTKPLPGIYACALRDCQASAETTVMIGDNPDADIAGAHRAGWRTIYFNFKQQPIAPGMADATVTSLAEIEQLL